MAATSEGGSVVDPVARKPSSSSVGSVIGETGGEGAWLNAHNDPVASLYTFTSCMGEPAYMYS